MLWKFENIKSKQKWFVLPNREYIVGRQEADFIINDKSVSRRHAKLFLDNENDLIIIEDLSRFGTFINSNKLINKSGFIKDGDTVTFGAQPGVDFECSIMEFDLIISTLIQSEKVKLLEYINVFGGELLNDWSDNVQYLVMSSLKVTYKVICALIKQVPIVTPDFIKEMHDYVIGKISVEPLLDNFLPKTIDANILDKNISFKPDIKRSILFYGKTFYFLSSKKLSHLELAILSAGGKVVLINESNLFTTKDELNNPHSIVMYENTENNLVTEVYTILKQCRKRPVIDSEIGFAVLHVNTDDYCNPLSECTYSIYKDTHLSQFLSVNPFHIDPEVSTSNILIDSNHKITRKRIYSYDEISIENIAKRPKSSFKENLKSSITEKENQIQVLSKDKTFQDLKKTNTVDKIIPVKRKTPLENLLKDNNTFFTKTPEKHSLNIYTKEKIRDDFDSDFDQLEMPNLDLRTKVIPSKNYKEESLFKISNISVTESQLEKQQCREIPKEFSKVDDQPVHLIGGTSVLKRAVGVDLGTLPNYTTDTEGKMTTFKSLVVRDLKEASKVNFNFKTFSKVSRVYINYNVVAFDTFIKSKY